MTNRLSKLFSGSGLTISAAFYGAVAALDYDLDRLTADAEAVILDLRDSLAINIPEENQAKILAGIAVATTDLVYKDLGAFISFCNLATDSDPASPDVFDPADIYEIAWGRIEIAMIDPQQEEELVTEGRNPFMRDSLHPKKMVMQFSDEIRKYCGAILYQEGAIRPIFSIPDAIMTKTIAIDQPEFYAAARSRHDTVEQDVASFVQENLQTMLAQLAQIRTRDGQPLITKSIGQGLVQSLSFNGGGDTGTAGTGAAGATGAAEAALT